MLHFIHLTLSSFYTSFIPFLILHFIRSFPHFTLHSFVPFLILRFIHSSLSSFYTSFIRSFPHITLHSFNAFLLLHNLHLSLSSFYTSLICSFPHITLHSTLSFFNTSFIHSFCHFTLHPFLSSFHTSFVPVLIINFLKRSLVEIIEHGLVDEQQKVRTITALAIAALAEAATPYGIESFDSVLKPLWKGIRTHRGKGLAAFLKVV